VNLFLALPLLLLAASTSIRAELFRLPTVNRALFEPGGEERFLVGTVGKPYLTGRFGCVRTDGRQMHEGIDIKCVQRDRRGEPMDRVMATADGIVAYINSRAGLSNYGKYLVLRHRIDGINVYSIYAHLSAIQAGLRTGSTVTAGQTIAIMGHTANTHEGISRDRAHLHFEIDLVMNERFATWYKERFPGQRNDHGNWNGLNLVGLDPRVLFLTQAAQGDTFSLVQFIRNRTDLCRVLVRRTHFPWLAKYTSLIKRNPVAEREGAAGYEVALDYNGLPYQLIPRAPSEVRTGANYQLLSVNEAEEQEHPCRKLVSKTHGHWELTTAGINILDLLTY
jgi:peptidoglycan LD-endopeptidase LytH